MHAMLEAIDNLKEFFYPFDKLALSGTWQTLGHVSHGLGSCCLINCVCSDLQRFQITSSNDLLQKAQLLCTWFDTMPPTMLWSPCAWQALCELASSTSSSSSAPF